MNDCKTAAKLRAQLKRLLGELLPHFSKPRTAFLGDMFCGIMAGGDVKLSGICRAYRPTITMKKAGDRLCMHLGDERIERTLHEFIAANAASAKNPTDEFGLTFCRDGETRHRTHGTAHRSTAHGRHGQRADRQAGTPPAASRRELPRTGTRKRGAKKATEK